MQIRYLNQGSQTIATQDCSLEYSRSFLEACQRAVMGKGEAIAIDLVLSHKEAGRLSVAADLLGYTLITLLGVVVENVLVRSPHMKMGHAKTTHEGFSILLTSAQK
jgi:hypothetical protein